MTDKNQEQIEAWFAEHYDYEKNDEAFEAMQLKPFNSSQACAIAFVNNKTKPEHKADDFLHGEHDILYLGDFDKMEDFTENEVKTALAYGLNINEFGTGFSIYASM